MNIINIRIKRALKAAFAIVLTLSAWNFAAAQTGKTVVFPSRSMTIAEAFAQIEKQTQYLISVGHTDFHTSRRVELTSTELTVENAMKELLAGSGRTCIIRGWNVLVVPEPDAPQPKAETPAKAAPVKTKPEAAGTITPVMVPVPVLQPEPQPAPVAVPQPVVEPEPVIKPSIDPAAAARLRLEAARSAAQTPDPRPMRFALKTNLLYTAVSLTPNLAFEAGLGPKSTIDVGAGYNWWKMDGTDASNRKLGHWIIQPEYRWWLCERFNGHYFGAHVFGGMFNISEHKAPLLFGEKNSADYRYDGWFAGVGASYGYQLPLARSWNLEFNLGVGYALMRYDRYEHERCGELIQPGVKRNYFGPTKLGITLTYLIK